MQLFFKRILTLIFPSWRFFESFEHACELRILHNGKWESALQAPKRKFLHLFFNPWGNLYLAEQSAVEQLYRVLVEQSAWTLKELQEHPLYSLVDNIAKEKLLQRNRSKKESAFSDAQKPKWKISILNEDVFCPFETQPK